MTPDIEIHDYYYKYISDAKLDVIKYKHILDNIVEPRNILFAIIKSYKTSYKTIFNINLDDYKEYTKQEYNDAETLYNKCTVLFRKEKDTKNKELLIYIIKFCNILRSRHKYERLIELANKRRSLTFKQYRAYVNNYYTKVHKCLLEGNAYLFCYGIGSLLINYWKFNEHKKVKIDYIATKKRKQELIDKGIKIYDKEEAEQYKRMGIPYDGVDYRVFMDVSNCYEFAFIGSKLFSNKTMNFDKTQYVNKKYKHLDYKQMADLCETPSDIYNFPVDVKHKLNMLLHKYPNKYLNFVRNAEQQKLIHRTNNS